MNIRLSAPFRLILAALLVLSLQACATRGTEIGTSAPSDASNAAWQAYQGYASARASDHDPYRLSGSLRYGSQGDTRRVETLLWSNGYLPIRLDVMAGIGALVARIQETQDSFTAYAPEAFLQATSPSRSPAASCRGCWNCGPTACPSAGRRKRGGSWISPMTTATRLCPTSSS